MGFERVTSIIQGTRGFTDFANAKISNYETDIFRPIFDELEKLSGKKYGSTLPQRGGSAGVPPAPVSVPLTGSSHIPATDAAVASSHASGSALAETAARDAQQSNRDGRAPHSLEQIQIDIAFRVIADHIRTLTFAIADGIQPSNEARGYVLRRILRRAVRYGRTLGFHEPFFYKLVDVLAEAMGDVFLEIRARKKHVQEVILREEEAFNKTLDRGLTLFHEVRRRTRRQIWFSFFDSEKDSDIAIHSTGFQLIIPAPDFLNEDGIPKPSAMPEILKSNARWLSLTAEQQQQAVLRAATFPGEEAFKLYDTYGFPSDLTELIAREWGLTVDKAGFDKQMEEQKARARASQKKEVISVSQIETTTLTQFVGYATIETTATVLSGAARQDQTDSA